MNISDYGKYRVKCKGTIVYNTPSYEYPNDWHTEKIRWQKTLSGTEMFDFLFNLHKDIHINKSKLVEMSIIDNKITISEFIPYSGEENLFTYTVEEVFDKTLDKKKKITL